MISKAILIIGASGRTGNHIIQQVSHHASSSTSKVKVFAFCRDPSKLDSEIKDKCDKVIKGNARKQEDLERAVTGSGADLVIVSIGNGDSVKKSDIRTESAKALVAVLSKPSNSRVQVLMISSTGAGGSRIKIGFGIGLLIEFHLRHILKDHNDQEATFLASMKARTMIVRPTALVEDKATGKVALFSDKEKSPSIQTDRKDLAEWLVTEVICPEDKSSHFDHFGSKPVNVTCLK